MANLFDPPGRPFGYAFVEERTRIEDHVLRWHRKRGWHVKLYDMRVQERVRRIQARLHKYDKTFAERSRAWAEEQRRAREAERNSADVTFSREELERLVDLFAAANDPLTANIGAKAKKALDTLPQPS